MIRSPRASLRFVVAIPARDEALRIEACLRALCSQREEACDHIVLLLNNCTDDSAARVQRLRPQLDVPITVVVRNFPPGRADAGHARSHAMAIAARIAGADGIIATTDADGAVSPDWVARTRNAFARGADAVCGRALIDPVEAVAVAPALHADDAREVAYAAMLDEIHALVDPDPADPLPRHSENSGASIAVTVAAYRRAGGMAPLPSGEDRGFLRALRLVDARIRHAPELQVTVSGRLQGRAAGGMAETMARRMICQDALLDAELEPALICLRRAGLRARARAAWNARGEAAETHLHRILAREAALPACEIARWLQAPYFGAAWLRIEAESPVLTRVAVARHALDRQVAAAGRILADLRGGAIARGRASLTLPAGAAGPAGSRAAAEVRPQ